MAFGDYGHVTPSTSNFASDCGEIRPHPVLKCVNQWLCGDPLAEKSAMARDVSASGAENR
jgi:hypothetical protein